MKKYLIYFWLIVFLACTLRFFKLSAFPPGLYSDEAALGYNAYSILKTGKDEFGNFLPLTFRSFGDYKPPLSSYFMIPSIFAFDLNEFSVRFPFALIGVLSVILIYFLALEIFRETKNKQVLALLAAFFLTISPWHLGQSRSAMLVGLEVFFNALGVYFFLKGLKNSRWFFLSALNFSLAVYAYYGSRVTAPLIIMVLLIFFRKEFFANKTNLLKFLLGFIVLSPLFIAILEDPETLLGRAKYMSIFYDRHVWGQLWEASALDGANFPTILTRFFHNKLFYYGKDILKRWLQHFEWNFLFIKGDSVPPFYIPGMGLLYLIDWPFLLIGIYFFIKEKTKFHKIILFWLFLAPLVSALTFMTPAANRSFNMTFPLYLTIAYGLYKFIEFKKKWAIIIKLTCLTYFLFLGYYLYCYYCRLPLKVADKWHYGRKRMVEKITKLQNNYEKVIVTGKGGPAYIFLLFYEHYDPNLYRMTMRVDPYINELGWGHIFGFDKYDIPREFDWRKVEKSEETLYISYNEEVPDVWQEPVNGKQLRVNILDKIYFPNKEVAYKIFDLQTVD